MAKQFNVTGLCVPEKHYMVDMAKRIDQIRKMVDAGAYFTINRARQYGKTTTLAALGRTLDETCLVISLDFQDIGNESFQDENIFSFEFLQIFLEELRARSGQEIADMAEVMEWMQGVANQSGEKFNLRTLFKCLLTFCERSDKPVVLMIDEVDSASNNQVFLDFLAQLRSHYLKREAKGTPTFQSVILAGVYDIKNLKRKIRPDEEHKMNSPWNIATDFIVDMSLPRDGIEEMLKKYAADHELEMDTGELATLIYDYTSGYPYLVSRLCKLMDERICPGKAWTRDAFLEAVRVLLMDNNTLFESLIGKLFDYPELERILRELLFSGKPITYNPTNPEIGLALMFGFVKNENGKVVPANRIFDTLLYNHFLSLDEMKNSDIYKASLRDEGQFVKNGHLDMCRILEKFVQHFHELYGDCKENFLEEEGRRYFLLYLRPIINGTGNYYVESRTRSLGRTDIVVDYRGEQFVIETKIWRGNEYNMRGEHQLVEYLEDYGLHTGYMLSFNFNKKKEVGVRVIHMDGKTLIEGVV